MGEERERRKWEKKREKKDKKKEKKKKKKKKKGGRLRSLVSARRPLGLRGPARRLRTDRLHASSVRDRSSGRHPPLQRHRLLRSDCGVRQRLPDIPHRPEQLVLRALLRCGCDLPLPSLPPGLPQLDSEPLPHDGRRRHPRRCTPLRHSWRHRGKHLV